MTDFIEDGSPCDQKGCNGHFEPSEVVGCSCHINPPCGRCVDAGYTCDTCGHDTNPAKDPDPYETLPHKPIDRSGYTTTTETVSIYNSTPFTRCCGTAAINVDRCPSCNARITRHDDGLAEIRRLAKGGCLMCGKHVGDITKRGNCHC